MYDLLRNYVEYTCAYACDIGARLEGQSDHRPRRYKLTTQCFISFFFFFFELSTAAGRTDPGTVLRGRRVIN